MFYTYAEKKNRSFWGEWHLREVAFDTRRRYLYYTAPIRSSAAPSPPPQHVNPCESASRIPSENSNTNTKNRSSNAQTLAAASEVVNSQRGVAVEGQTWEAEGSEAAVCSLSSWHKAHWVHKMKVVGIVPVATVHHFDIHDPAHEENDFFQIKITGEARRLLKDEVPPVGPLLCPSAGLTSLDTLYAADSEVLIKDPDYLIELFEAIRDQFDEMEREVQRARGSAAASEPSTVKTLKSPVTPPHGGYPVKKITLRCRDELEFRRFWFVLQSVLGYDKLMVRPYRGLPPYDPRNGVSFAHIPMLVWHTFAALDKAVFYVFARGDVVGGAAGVYLCVTHDMVLFIRDTGGIEGWLRQQHLRALHHGATARGGEPFVAFLSDPPARAVGFVPRPPAYGPRAIAAFDPRRAVRRIVRVMGDVCFASLSVRRAIRIEEVEDASAAAYFRRRAEEDVAAPWQLPRGGGEGGGALAQGALSCPLPKEQLANVWEQVQEELRARRAVAQDAAIPINERNAQEISLTREQLTFLAWQLEEERERLDEIVGMPLERAQRIRPTEGGEGLMLETPQLHRDLERSGDSSGRRRSQTGSFESEGSSYLTPGARYLTAKEGGEEDGRDPAARGGGARTVNEIIDESLLAMEKRNK